VNDGTIVWRNVDNSFWCLPVKYAFVRKYPELSKQHLDALLGLKKFFELNGVQFIISVVPFYYDMAARVMNPEFRNVPDYQTALLVQQLLSAGIETIYASDEIIKNYNRYEWAYFYPANGHPSDAAQSVLAECIASRLERYHFPKQYRFDLFTFKKHAHVYGQD